MRGDVRQTNEPGYPDMRFPNSEALLLLQLLWPGTLPVWTSGPASASAACASASAACASVFCFSFSCCFCYAGMPMFLHLFLFLLLLLLLSAFVLQLLPLLLQAEAAAGRVHDESDCNHLSAGARF